MRLRGGVLVDALALLVICLSSACAVFARGPTGADLMLEYQKSAIAGRTPRKQSVLIFSL